MLEKKQYDVFYTRNQDVEGRLRDAFITAAEEYTDSELCFSDIFAEVADRFTPIYNSELLEAVSDVDGYLQECFEEGLIPVNKDITICRIIQVGYYEMIQQSLYDNLKTIVYNCAIEILSEKEFIKFCNDSRWIDLFIPELEDFAKSFDTSDGPQEIRKFIKEQVK